VQQQHYQQQHQQHQHQQSHDGSSCSSYSTSSDEVDDRSSSLGDEEEEEDDEGYCSDGSLGVSVSRRHSIAATPAPGSPRLPERHHHHHHNDHNHNYHDHKYSTGDHQVAGGATPGSSSLPRDTPQPTVGTNAVGNNAMGSNGRVRKGVQLVHLADVTLVTAATEAAAQGSGSAFAASKRLDLSSTRASGRGGAGSGGGGAKGSSAYRHAAPMARALAQLLPGRKVKELSATVCPGEEMAFFGDEGAAVVRRSLAGSACAIHA
jgi:hypothetical protein